jgi:hypothetical protein
MLHDYLLSLIRTYVPVAIGTVLTYLATHFNVVLPEDASAGLLIGATGIVVGLYYGLVRALETRWPWFGKLLGKQAQPAYVEARR